MFNQKSKSDISLDSAIPVSGASIIASGTTLKGDITSTGDIRIDGTLNGNINCSAKVVIGANGIVEGDITGQQADIMGKVNGTIKVKELLQLKGGSTLSGNIYASKLQIETSANFNGQCHMTNNSTSNPSKAASNGSSEVKSDKPVVIEPAFTLK
ncbi:MAG TPA: polymer-forming cytoskeletal protein [Flavitalea sp.]|nr:polymer-forming cytoskeletal protein [Flavitalea sp.]